jgi:hypothetical protein
MLNAFKRVLVSGKMERKTCVNKATKITGKQHNNIIALVILHSSRNDWKMIVVYWRMHRGTLATVALSTLLIDLMT